MAFFITIVVTYFVMATGFEVLWYEALIMMLLYACYILLMVFNDRLMAALDNTGKLPLISFKTNQPSNLRALCLFLQLILLRNCSIVPRKSLGRM